MKTDSTCHSRPSVKKLRAFTLIELLCVVTVISMLVAFVGLTVPASLASQRLSSAARQFSADLNYATLLAGKESRPVELRFYQLPPSSGLGTVGYRGYQVGIVTSWDAQARPQVTFKDEVQRFPDDVVFMPDANYTTLYTASPSDSEQTVGAVQGAPYVSYYIRSDGVTTLAQKDPAVFTLVRETSKGVPSTLPADYRSIVVDPQKHQTRVY
ncbi:MAG: Verru_Chthon cassette protein D [Verrucomicrobium sp.]|nr:Verru_Chthon cassette protein D [Verrucomicrobium sp.]